MIIVITSISTKVPINPKINSLTIGVINVNQSLAVLIALLF